VRVAERGRGHRRAPDRSLRRAIGRRLGRENPAPVLQKPARVLQTERIGSNTRTPSPRDRACGTPRRRSPSRAAAVQRRRVARLRSNENRSEPAAGDGVEQPESVA
jgi:hypothetical protein